MAPTERFSASKFLADMDAGGPVAELAARLLLKTYRPKLQGLFFNKGVRFADMDELEAEVFSAVIHGRHELRDPKAFGAWIGSIAKNVVNQHWRQKMHHDRYLVIDRESFEESPEDESPQLTTQLLPDLSTSDPEVRRCFCARLSAFQETHSARVKCIELIAAGNSDREIAEALGRSYGATRQYISQCCALLADYLSVCIGPDELRGRRRGQARTDG